MLKSVYNWFWSRDFSFWQNVGHFTVIVVLVVIGLWGLTK